MGTHGPHVCIPTEWSHVGIFSRCCFLMATVQQDPRVYKEANLGLSCDLGVGKAFRETE